MICSKNGIKKEGESCTLNNNCIYPLCMEEGEYIILKSKYVNTEYGIIDKNGKIIWENPLKKYKNE